jgi:MFS family permease
MADHSDRLDRWANLLALNRTVAVVLATVLFFGLGEQLWESFMPAYLDARVKDVARAARLTPGVVDWRALAIIAAYASLRNLFEAFCYVGGGQLTARLGDRGSLILFAFLTLAGYGIFLLSSSPLAATGAAMLILGWEPLSVPVTFTTVGSSVDRTRQGMAFALQSIQKRLPKVLGPMIAGFVIAAAQRHSGDAAAGRIVGMNYLVGAALALGLASLVIQFLFMPHRPPPPPHTASAAAVVRGFHPMLRRLLIAEILTRWCDWLVREFVVLYVLIDRGSTDWFYGVLLVPAQHLTALATYLPIGSLTRRVGLQPFIGLTFVFFALFPLSLAWASDGAWLLGAFVVYGLREIGEPARKALITSLMPEPTRARGVGLYWGLRSVAISTAPLAGAAIWHCFGPTVLLHVAFALGVLGAAVFYFFCAQVQCRSDV